MLEHKISIDLDQVRFAIDTEEWRTPEAIRLEIARQLGLQPPERYAERIRITELNKLLYSLRSCGEVLERWTTADDGSAHLVYKHHMNE